MSTLPKILLGIGQFGRVLAIVLGLYAYLWRPGFMAGSTAGPYWLLLVYVTVAPLLLGIAFVGGLIMWVMRFVLGIFGQNVGAPMLMFGTVLMHTVIIGFIAAFPVLAFEFDHMQATQFNGRQYNLIRQEGFGEASYGVVRCQDPAGFSCRSIHWSEEVPAPPPTPTPFPETIEVGDQRINVSAQAFPTVTPSAEFVNDTTGRQLSLKIGPYSRMPITASAPITMHIPISIPLPIDTESGN